MLTGKISQRIKTYMDKRGMDLKGLAEQTGLSVPFLKNMLTENVYPPLGPLMKIARALDLRLGTFLDDQGKVDPFIVRHSTRAAEFSVSGVSGKSPALNFYALGTGKMDRHMEPFFCGDPAGIRRRKNLVLGRISRYKIPRYVHFVTDYPMTASGKIQKYKLTEMAETIWPERR